MLSVGAYSAIHSGEIAEARKEFHYASGNQAQVIKQSIDRKMRILESVRAFFKSSQVVERDEFSEFTMLFAALPDTEAIAWVPRVLRQQRNAYENQAITEGLENFRFTECDGVSQIIPAPQHDEYFPVWFVEPFDSNRTVLGLNVAANSAVMDAIRIACDTSDATVTSRVMLDYKEVPTCAVLVLLPIYQRHMPADTIDQRRQNLEGFVVGVFGIGDLVEHATAIVETDGLDMHIFDVSDPNRTDYIYPRHAHSDPPTSLAADNQSSSLADFKYSEVLNLDSRKWLLRTLPTDEFASRYLTTRPALVAAIILIITGFLTVMFYLNATRTSAIENEVIQRTSELAASRARFRAIFDQTFQFIGLLNTDGTVIEANRTSLEFARISASEVIGKPYWKTPWWRHSPQIQQQIEDAVGKAAAGQFLRFEVHTPDPDGTLHHVDFSLKPVFDDENRVCLLIPEGRDITYRKHIEKERENLLKTLEAKNKELYSVVYVASHDLKSPLVNLQGFSCELKRSCSELAELFGKENYSGAVAHRLGEVLNNDIPVSLKFILASTEKMQSLLEGLLKISRVGTAEIDIRPLDMNRLVKNVLRTMEYQIKERDISLTVEQLPKCLGDETQIDQVFTNLVDNALKYMDPTRPGTIRISGTVDDDTSVYCVTDNGIGIAPQYHEKIFELFHRLSPDGPIQGDGLGLTIITRILDRNNGRIRVESESGKGASFFVALPTAG
jgi:PAS domain S-box-containing protein